MKNITTKTDKPAVQMWGAVEHNFLRNQAQKALDEYKATQKKQKVYKVTETHKTYIEVDASMPKKEVKRRIAKYKALIDVDL